MRAAIVLITASLLAVAVWLTVADRAAAAAAAALQPGPTCMTSTARRATAQQAAETPHPL